MAQKTKIDQPKIQKPIIETTQKVAVVLLGGKQYLVKVGSQIKAEKIEGEKELKVDDMLNGKKVTLEIIETKKGKKVTGVKFKNKTRRQKFFGHRQWQTTLKVKAIQ